MPNVINTVETPISRQYVGARYVPIFDGAWDNTKDYAPLTVVTHEGNSYTSRTYVPSGTAITNETYWALSGNYNAQVESYRQEVADLSNDVYSTISTPQMFGAIGDGINNDTEAFRELAAADGNVFIPKGDYKITEVITLHNVIADEGNYLIYKPEYAKTLKLNLNGLSDVHKRIALPATDMYEEDACIINNKLYVITNEYNDGNNGIAVYDSSYTLTDYATSAKTTVGTCCNCCTDGTYLYVDYANHYHAKFSPADLTSPILLVEADYDYICHDNGMLYAVKINASNVEVSRLDDTLEVLSDTITVSCTRQTLQSATIYNGQLYIPTTVGTFYVIDLVSEEVLGVDFRVAPIEIEGFFEMEGKLVAIAHDITVGGVFNIKAFNDGASEQIIRFIEVDCDHEFFDPTLVSPEQRTAIYHVINGESEGMPSDNCIVQWLGDNIFCFARSKNAIYYWYNKWIYFRSYVTDGVTFDGNKALLRVGANGTLYFHFRDYQITEASKVISYDFSDIFSKLGYADNAELRCSTIGYTYGVAPFASDVYGVHILLKKDRVGIWVKSLLGVDQQVNCSISGTIFVYD